MNVSCTSKASALGWDSPEQISQQPHVMVYDGPTESQRFQNHNPRPFLYNQTKDSQKKKTPIIVWHIIYAKQLWLQKTSKNCCFWKLFFFSDHVFFLFWRSETFGTLDGRSSSPLTSALLLALADLAYGGLDEFESVIWICDGIGWYLILLTTYQYISKYHISSYMLIYSDNIWYILYTIQAIEPFPNTATTIVTDISQMTVAERPWFLPWTCKVRKRLKYGCLKLGVSDDFWSPSLEQFGGFLWFSGDLHYELTDLHFFAQLVRTLGVFLDAAFGSLVFLGAMAARTVAAAWPMVTHGSKQENQILVDGQQEWKGKGYLKQTIDSKSNTFAQKFTKKRVKSQVTSGPNMTQKTRWCISLYIYMYINWSGLRPQMRATLLKRGAGTPRAFIPTCQCSCKTWLPHGYHCLPLIFLGFRGV